MLTKIYNFFTFITSEIKNFKFKTSCYQGFGTGSSFLETLDPNMDPRLIIQLKIPGKK